MSKPPAELNFLEEPPAQRNLLEDGEARTPAPRPGWRYVDEPPAGLVYQPSFLSVEGELAVLADVERLEFEGVEMRGQVARRTVAHFGRRYGYNSWRLEPAPGPPPFLAALRERVAGLAELDPTSLEQILITRYPAGATIGWHGDAPVFGPTVIGVSLGASAQMRFRRRAEAERYEVYRLALARGSAYVIGGAARADWQHSLSPLGARRYSITFRTVKRPA